MENTKDTNIPVPYIAYEASEARWERTTKRLIAVVMAAVILLVASNGAWLWAWVQYDYSGETTTTETVTVDGKDGIANYVNRGGSVVYGFGETCEENHEEQDADA